MFSALKNWLPLAFVTTVLCGLVYAAVQQDLRQTANDLPAQIAEDIAFRLEHGMQIESAVGAVAIDIEKSLSPFVIIYDEQNRALASSAVLDGVAPQVPAGVLEYARAHGEHRVTWQPQPGVRHAIVVVTSNTEPTVTIVVGHSLREVEKRAAQLTIFVTLAWIAALAGSFGLMVFLQKTAKK